MTRVKGSASNEVSAPRRRIRKPKPVKDEDVDAEVGALRSLNENGYVSLRQLSILSGMSYWNVRKAFELGQLQTVRVGERQRVFADEAHAYIRKYRPQLKR